MPILTTDLGLKAIANANAGGFLVDMKRFALTEATSVKLSIGDTALVGTPVYSAEIESIEVVSAATVKVTMFLPPKLPRTGRWTLTEIGLYLETGELFAHGTFKVPYEKTGEFGLKVYVYVTAARLGEVINITLGTNASLASAASVRSLIEPSRSQTNAIVVQDASTNNYSASTPTSGSLAVRYGAGGLNWAFLGYDLQYRGYATDVINPGRFILNTMKHGGFWLSQDEVVIVQIISGPGAGESRRVKYNRDYIRFEVLEKDFSELSAQSLLHIWRSTKEQLPFRAADIDTNYVLGVGVNTWKKEEISNATASTNLVPVRVSLVGADSVTYRLPSSVPKAVLLDKKNFLVYVNGLAIDTNYFSVSVEQGLTLFTDPVATGVPIELVYYKRIVSSGASLTFSIAEYDATGRDWSFNTSIVPNDSNYVMTFVEGLIQPAANYIYSGTQVTFTKAAPVGKVVLVQCANFEELGAASTIIRHESKLQIINNVIQPILIDADYLEKKNTLVSIDGKLITHDKYEVFANKITLTGNFGAGSSINIVAFTSSVEPVLIESITGENTGPVWVDPAGAFIPTNRIVPVRASYIGDGIRKTFAMNSRADKALVFLHGLHQDPRYITIDSEVGSITLPDVVEKGMELDIISFESFADTGRELVCWRQKFKTVANQRVYTIPAPAEGREPLLTIISVGGVYAHAGKYTQTATNISFTDDIPENMNVEVFHFASIDHPGYSNQMSFGSTTLQTGRLNYVHAYYDDVPIEDSGREENTLLFASTVLQKDTDYTVDNRSSYSFNIPNVGTAGTVHATSVVFYTGKSKTRLLQRQEAIDRYITREEILGDQTTLTDDERPTIGDQLLVIWKLLNAHPELLNDEAIAMLKRLKLRT